MNIRTHHETAKDHRFRDVPMSLDKKDFALIEALQQNASRRLEDLAKLVHLAPSSVHDRLLRLERVGIIRQWTIKVDAQALGLGVLAFVGIRATRPCSELVEALRVIPSIEECHSVAGELSMMLKVRVANTAVLLELSDRLRAIPGVEQTETTIVLKTQIDRPIAAV
jgi:Lrp/AsnC family transcriptional regulator, leucine-responsive regulatory protein